MVDAGREGKTGYGCVCDRKGNRQPVKTAPLVPFNSKRAKVWNFGAVLAKPAAIGRMIEPKSVAP
jgi:hypothetical protein